MASTFQNFPGTGAVVIPVAKLSALAYLPGKTPLFAGIPIRCQLACPFIINMSTSAFTILSGRAGVAEFMCYRRDGIFSRFKGFG
jgi:hypothetical protein